MITYIVTATLLGTFLGFIAFAAISSRRIISNDIETWRQARIFYTRKSNLPD